MYYAENDKLTSCAAVIKDKKNPSEINDFRGILVRVVRLERTVSWSQSKRATNCANPGYRLLSFAPDVVKHVVTAIF